MKQPFCRLYPTNFGSFLPKARRAENEKNYDPARRLQADKCSNKWTRADRRNLGRVCY